MFFASCRPAEPTRNINTPHTNTTRHPWPIELDLYAPLTHRCVPPSSSNRKQLCNRSSSHAMKNRTNTLRMQQTIDKLGYTQQRANEIHIGRTPIGTYVCKKKRMHALWWLGLCAQQYILIMSVRLGSCVGGFSRTFLCK